MTAGLRSITRCKYRWRSGFPTGLSFLVTYNLSRMMSNTNSGFTSFAHDSLNKNNQKAEWSIDNNDQPNTVNIAGTYELPIGKGKAFLNNRGIASNLLGGWQISPILTYAHRHSALERHRWNCDAFQAIRSVTVARPAIGRI